MRPLMSCELPQYSHVLLGKVTVEDGNAAPRSIYRTVGQTSSFGGNPLEQNIGLGHNAHEVSLDIWWPATGTRQHFTGVTKNQHLEIKEFATNYTRLDRRPFQLRRNPAPVEAAATQTSTRETGFGKPGRNQ